MGLSSALSRTAGVVGGAVTTTAGSAVDVSSSLAGAASGAVLGGSVEALRGGVRGALAGAGRGTRSTPAMVATGVALGIAGIVDWPLLLVVGGVAVVANRRHATSTPPVVAKVDSQPISSVSASPRVRTAAARTSTPRTSTPRTVKPRASTPRTSKARDTTPGTASAQSPAGAETGDQPAT